jgi:hypothetical protein
MDQMTDETNHEDQPKDQPGGDFWVNGIVAARNGMPYVQLSNEKGMIAQLTMAQTRQIAMDMLVMSSRTEADAMIHAFFSKLDLPLQAAMALMQDLSRISRRSRPREARTPSGPGRRLAGAQLVGE